MKSVIDRFVSDHAILLVGDSEIQLDVPRELLPDDAKEGECMSYIRINKTQRNPVVTCRFGNGGTWDKYAGGDRK